MLNIRLPQWRVLFTAVLIVSQLIQSSGPMGLPLQAAPASVAARAAQPAARLALTQVERLLAAPHTITLTAAGFAPDMIQVTAGQAVTFTNADTRTRRVMVDAASESKIFLPLVMRNSASLAASTAPGPTQPAAVSSAARSAPSAAVRSTAGEIITLAAGQSVTRTFGAAGNVLVSDADNPATQATILVTPLPLPKDGHIQGIVLDFKTKLPIAGARVKALDTSFEATADAAGQYRLFLPGGEYTLVMYASGYSFANRKVKVQSYSPTGIDTVELVPLDSAVTPIGGAGGVVTNSVGNTSVVVAASALTSTKAMRLTWLPVNAQTGDFSALPGTFTDGNMPIGFVMFEPDGTQFSAPVTWTIEYTGDLPVGTSTPCYYWIESEARWGDPVAGRVIDLGGGKKGLQAVLPHFSSYGFAPPPPPIPDPPQNPPEAPADPTDPAGPEDNPEGPNNQCNAGSQINLMSGELCQTVGTLSLPTVGALPTQITARYHSLNVTSTRVISTAFGPATGQLTPQATWTFNIAGRVMTGAGKQPYVEWDGRDANGVLLPPGAHQGRLWANWKYDYSYTNCTFPTPPTCRQVHALSYFTQSTPWFVQVRRNDLSPWGIGWFGPHDVLLVDRGDTVSIVQGDGRQVSFARETNGAYRPPKSDFSVLAQQPDGGWTRTFKDGGVLTFNADGRLIRIADRYGNAQVILYESNGKTVPAGSWGLTTRIRRVLDSSGNQWDYAYDANGWLASITDNTGRVLRLTHDAQGHLTGVTDPLDQIETFAYDDSGSMTSHTDRRGHTTNYALDARGRVVTRVWPTGTSLQMSYDRLRVNVLSDRGTPLVTTLDGNYSPIQRYNGVYTMATTYNDDLLPAGQDTPPQQTLYDAQGNVIDLFAARHMALDHAAPYQQISRLAVGNELDTRFEYDIAGNLTRVTDALGQSYQMGYDARGQLSSVTDPLGRVTSFERDARGQVTRVTDPLNRVVTFTYDAAGNRITGRDPLSRTTSMEYDALNRLTAVLDALNGRASLQYDANGNMTKVVDQTARPITYTYDALNRATGVTYADGGTNFYTYDASSNVIGITDARGLTRTYTYDAAGRLALRQVQDGLTTAYAYDRYDQLMSAADGVITRTTSYVSGTVGYPLRVQQRAASLPISTTVDYQYSNGQVRAAGTAPLAAASAQAPVSVGDVPQTQSDALVGNAPMSVAPRPASPSGPDTLAQRTAAQSTAAPIPTRSVQSPIPLLPAAVSCASIANGNWSSPATWSCGDVPTDTAVIDGESVTVDVSPTLRSLVFEGGTLVSSGMHTIDVTETLVFTTSALKFVQGGLQINNAGTGLWTGGNIGGRLGPTLNNLAGAVFDISADGVSMYVGGGNGQATFNNLGTVVKSAGSGNVTIGGGQGWTLFNDGLVQVLTGTLTVGDDLRVGVGTGQFQVASGATLYFWRGNYTLASGSTITGSGTVAFGGFWQGSSYHGVVHLGGAYTIGSTIIDSGMACFDNPTPGAAAAQQIELRSGYLGGAGVVRASETFTWTGGEIRQNFGAGGSPGCGSATSSSGLEIAAGANSLISTTTNVWMRNYAITNSGTLVWDGNGNINGASMRISNLPGGLFDIRSDRSVSVGGGNGSGFVDNAGVLRKSGGTGTAALDGAQGPDVTNAGVVEVWTGALQLRQYRQTAGATRLAGGNLIAGSGSAPTLIGGVLTGTGTIVGNVSNVGATISPGNSSGAITIQGNYTQGPTGTLAIEAGGLIAGSQHDALNVSGSATLSGVLSVTITNGFAPNRANRIQFMTYASRSGAFAQVTNPISATHPVDYRSTEAALGLPLPGFVLPGDGRLSGVSLTSNNNRAQTLGLTHDAIGRLAALRSAGYSTYTLAYAYDADSHITARQASAGSAPVSSYAYDAAGQLTLIIISDTSALTQLLRLDYAYDAAGNITGITSSRDGAAMYTYDALNRLTGVSAPGLNANYGYDAAGNRTSAGGVTFAYDAGGRLASRSDGATYTYDAVGRLLSRTRGGQTDTFVWDGLGKLTRINYADATYSEYRYDSAGRRVSKRGRDGTTAYYVYLGQSLAQELDASGAVIASYTYDRLDRPISMYRNGLTYFYLLDHLGSVLGLADENGAAAATYRYDPWGNVISSTGSVANPLRFTAREWDEESGLYFYRARYYDPQAGRFIGRDPLGVRGGINLYAYAANRPVNLRDPFGLLLDELLDYLFTDSRAEEAKSVVDRADQAMDLAQSAAELADAVENRDDPARGLDALEAIGDIVDTCFGAVGGFFGDLIGGAVGAVRDAPGGVEASERQGQCGSINRNACEMMRDLE